MCDLWDADLPGPTRAILGAATELFATRGFHAATTRQLSELVGLSPAGIYTYFPSKESILFAICSSAHVGTDRLIESALSESRSVEGLTRALGVFARWHAEERHIGRVAQFEFRALRGQPRREISESRHRTQLRVVDYVWALSEQGTIRVDDHRSLARGLMSLGVDVCRWYDPAGALRPDDIERIYRELAARILLSGRGGPSRSKTNG